MGHDGMEWEGKGWDGMGWEVYCSWFCFVKNTLARLGLGSVPFTFLLISSIRFLHLITLLAQENKSSKSCNCNFLHLAPFMPFVVVFHCLKTVCFASCDLHFFVSVMLCTVADQSTALFVLKRQTLSSLSLAAPLSTGTLHKMHTTRNRNRDMPPWPAYGGIVHVDCLLSSRLSVVPHYAQHAIGTLRYGRLGPFRCH